MSSNYLKILILFIIFTDVDAGCYHKRMCCHGRNVSCISVERGSRNVFNPDLAAKFKNREPSSTETFLPQPQPPPTATKSRNWHLHVPDMKIMDEEAIDNFTQWLNDHTNSRLDFNELEHPEFEHMMHEPEEYSGFEDDLGSGDSVDYVNFFNDSSVAAKRRPDGRKNAIQYEIQDGAKYEIVTDDNVELTTKKGLEKVEFNGNAKEISYVIISDKMQQSLDTYEKVGLLQHDKSVAKDCYCDEECRVLNDCCSDYIDMCPPQDCEVSAWTAWGRCQGSEIRDGRSKCGPGVSKRTRAVVEEPRLGGVRCPHLVEQRACYNVDGECGQLASEVALLLPYKYRTAREPGYKDKIYYDLPKALAKLNSMSSYCSIFDVYWLDMNCRDNETMHYLRPSAKVCVECQPAVQKTDNGDERCTGHGLSETKTLWSLINVKNCLGQWILNKKVASCECERDYLDFPKYIFV